MPMKGISELMVSRMKLLGLNVELLSEKSLIEEYRLRKLIHSDLSWSDFSPLEQSFIEYALLCDNSYFSNGNSKNKDLINSLGFTDSNINVSIGKIQRLAKDYVKLVRLEKELQEIES